MPVREHADDLLLALRERLRRDPELLRRYHEAKLASAAADSDAYWQATGTFPARHALARELAAAVMRWEQVPDLPLFANNTAAFIHELDAAAISNVAGDSNYVRVQVLTPVGALDRDKQLGVVNELTEIVAAAAGDASLPERTWVLLTESPEGGWGIGGHANTNADIAAAARAALGGQ